MQLLQTVFAIDLDCLSSSKAACGSLEAMKTSVVKIEDSRIRIQCLLGISHFYDR